MNLQLTHTHNGNARIKNSVNLSIITKVFDPVILQLFSGHIRNFLDAVHSGPKSNVPPRRLSDVETARLYLRKVYSGYKEIPNSRIKRIFSLDDVCKRNFFETHHVCLMTFLRPVTIEQMYDEIDSQIGNGHISGVADSALTTSFVYSKLTCGEKTKGQILIPTLLQNVKSPSKEFLRMVTFRSKGDDVCDEWKYLSTEIQKSASIVAFVGV